MADKEFHLWIPEADLVTDTSVATWAQDRQSGDLHRVDFQVPSGFERYCRILHRVDDQGANLTWNHCAELAGLKMRPGIQWYEIERECPELKRGRPHEGSLDDTSFKVFLQAVREWSESNVNLIAGFWVGKYKFAMSSIAFPTIELGLSDQALFEVRLDTLVSASQDPRVNFPGILYPTDRSWYMSTNIDYNSTLFGGSCDLIEKLIRDRSLEALEVSPELDLTYQLH